VPTEKFYCGSCGSPLYYGRKFQEHSVGRPCSKCGTPNPIYFHYCYRCGEKILPPGETEDET
jgi:ribosomal protein L40E